MLKLAQKTAEYPQRESLFILRVVKLLGVPSVARALGQCGCNLVRLIATIEDDQFYRGAVQVADSELRARLDVAEQALVTARRRAIDAGFLHYEPSNRRGVPSRIWVTLPKVENGEILQGENHLANGGLWGDIHPAGGALQGENHLANGGLQDENHLASGVLQGENHLANGVLQDENHLILRPQDPKDKSPPTPPPEKTWAEAEAAMIEFGIGETSQPIEIAKTRHVPPALIIAVVIHAMTARLWKPGKVRRRLLNLFPGQDPADPALWMPPDFHPAAAVIGKFASGPDLKKRDDRLRQLELQFGPELKASTIPELINRYGAPETVRDAMRSYPTWRAASRSPVAQLVFLEFLSSASKSCDVVPSA